MADIHHIFVLFSATALRLKLVADDLIVGPPLVTPDVLVDGAYLDIAISYVVDSVPLGLARGVGREIGALTSRTNEVFAFVGNRVPVPLEELGDDL